MVEKIDNRGVFFDPKLDFNAREPVYRLETLTNPPQLATKKREPGSDEAPSTKPKAKPRYIDYSGLKTSERGPPVKTGGRYEGMSWRDRVIFDLQNRTRTDLGDVDINVPDLSRYTSRLTPRNVSKSDVAQSKFWDGFTEPSKTYEGDMKTLEDMKYSILREHLKGVDRNFVNPNNVQELGKLSAEQKAALLIDLIEIKQNYNAYMNQYGDSVVNGEEAEQSIDTRIDALSNDAETAIYLNEAATAGVRDYLALPENSGMLRTLEFAFMDDLVGGKAIDRELAKGKSFDEAVAAYNTELAKLTELLPTDFIDDKIGIANVTFSRRVEEHFMGNGVPGDLSPFVADGSGKSGAISPVADAMALVFMAENANNPNMFLPAIKLNFANDIARGVDGIMRNMRNGVKFADAMVEFEKLVGSRPSPLGVDGDLYRAGLLHAVQTVTMAGVLVSRSLEPGKVWRPEEIAAAVASSVQILGMTTEGLAKNLDAAGKPFSVFGTNNGTFGRAISATFNPKTLESAGKILGAAGGAAMAGLSFFSASRSLKSGEDIKAAFEIISGTASLGSAIIGFTEAVLQLTNAIPRLFAGSLATTTEIVNLAQSFVKTGLSAAGLVVGAIGALAGMGLGLYDMVKGVQKLDKMEGKLNDQLEKYTGSYVEFVFRPRL